MALWDIGFRNIVDVDGQLLAIDANLDPVVRPVGKDERRARVLAPDDQRLPVGD